MAFVVFGEKFHHLWPLDSIWESASQVIKLACCINNFTAIFPQSNVLTHDWMLLELLLIKCEAVGLNYI